MNPSQDRCLNDLPDELWLSVPDFNGYYMVSNMGRVKTIPYEFIAKNNERYLVKEKILSQEETGAGYLRVTLSTSIINKKKRYLTHRLVASVWLNSSNSKDVVNHKNGDKKDNRVSNLEWGTQKQNIIHAINVLGRNYGAGAKRGINNPLVKKVQQIDIASGIVVRTWGSSEVRREFKSYKMIQCCLGERDFFNGYKWKYE